MVLGKERRDCVRVSNELILGFLLHDPAMILQRGQLNVTTPDIIARLRRMDILHVNCLKYILMRFILFGYNSFIFPRNMNMMIDRTSMIFDMAFP